MAKKPFRTVHLVVGETRICLSIHASSPIIIERIERVQAIPSNVLTGLPWTKWDGRSDPSSSTFPTERRQEDFEELVNFGRTQIPDADQAVLEHFAEFVRWVSDRDLGDFRLEAASTPASWTVRMHLAFEDWRMNNRRFKPTEAREYFARPDGPFAIRLDTLKGDDADRALTIYGRFPNNPRSDQKQLRTLYHQRRLLNESA